MQITSIKQAKKNSNRSNIFIDGKYSFSLSKTELSRLKLFRGQELSEETLKNFKDISNKEKVFDRVYNFLNIRPRSKKEIFNYLRYKRGLDEEETNPILEELINKGLLDDVEFANWWVENRLTFKTCSLNKIKAELIQKGIDKEIVSQALENIDPTLLEQQQAKLLELAKKYIKRLPKLNEYERKQKLMQYLSQKGFSYDEIQKVLAKTL